MDIKIDELVPSKIQIDGMIDIGQSGISGRFNQACMEINKDFDVV